MNVAVDFRAAVVHGVAFNLFAHAMNVCGVGVAAYEIHLCPINGMHVF